MRVQVLQRRKGVHILALLLYDCSKLKRMRQNFKDLPYQKYICFGGSILNEKNQDNLYIRTSG